MVTGGCILRQVKCSRRSLAPSCGLSESYPGADGVQPHLASRQLISARGMREAMLNVLFLLLSQQQTRISCDRYMIVVKETEMKCM